MTVPKQPSQDQSLLCPLGQPAEPPCGAVGSTRPVPGGAGSEAVAVNPAGARKQHLRAKCQPCLGWHPRQDLSLSLWKQAARRVNPLSLGPPAPLWLTVSLSPVLSQGWEAGDSGDSPFLVRRLRQGGGTHSPKALCRRGD